MNGTTAKTMVNALTIDVEDYFQVSAMAPYIDRADWEKCECRIERNIERILAMLDASGTKATFFTLGWIAQRYPGVVRDIIAGGHELASHGYAHQRASDLTPDEFFEDIHSAKVLLEEQSGRAVQGYRAPSFSIGAANREWAFECLARAGYRYSSSVYPVKHDHYGMPEAPRFAYDVHTLKAGVTEGNPRGTGDMKSPEGVTPRSVLEVPPTTVRAFDRNWPASGGGYFRLLPYAVSRRLINRVNRHDGQAAVFYFHPWEIDAEQPRVPGINAKTRFRHYLNLHRMEDRLLRLLTDFRWGRMDEIFLADRQA